jgi:hypothetical protein
MAEDSPVVEKNERPQRGSIEPTVPLCFVNLDQSNLGQDQQTKKLVRSHVMQQYRRRKTPGTSKPSISVTEKRVLRGRGRVRSVDDVLEDALDRLNVETFCTCLDLAGPNTSSLTARVPESGKTIFKLDLAGNPIAYCQDCKRCISRVSTGPPTTVLGAGKIDPFTSLPLKNQTKSFYLLDHCTNISIDN